MQEKDLIARYVESISAALDGAAVKGGTADRAILEEAARGIGLGEADLAIVEARRKELARSGASFMAKSLWDDAILVYEEACSLSPWDASLRAELGRALAAKGRLAPAKRAFREALAIDSSYAAAYEGLSSLEKKKKLSGKRLFVAISVLLIAFGLLATLVLKREPGISEGMTPSGEAGAVPSSPVPASDESYPRDVAISFEPGEQGFVYTASRSALEKYSTDKPAWAYRLAVRVSCPGQALEQAVFKASFLSGNGEVLFSRRIEGIQEYMPTFQPGDTFSLSLLVYEPGEPPDFTSVRLEPAFIVALPVSGGAGDETAGMEYSVVDESGGALGKGLKLSLRRYERSVGIVSDFLYADVSYRNEGSRALARLKLRCEWLDSGGTILAATSSWGFIEDDPLLLPGQASVCGFIAELGEGLPAVKGLRLYVEEAAFH